jgi:hypothetical protein
MRYWFIGMCLAVAWPGDGGGACDSDLSRSQAQRLIANELAPFLLSPASPGEYFTSQCEGDPSRPFDPNDLDARVRGWLNGPGRDGPQVTFYRLRNAFDRRVVQLEYVEARECETKAGEGPLEGSELRCCLHVYKLAPGPECGEPCLDESGQLITHVQRFVEITGITAVGNARIAQFTWERVPTPLSETQTTTTDKGQMVFACHEDGWRIEKPPQ